MKDFARVQNLIEQYKAGSYQKITPFSEVKQCIEDFQRKGLLKKHLKQEEERVSTVKKLITEFKSTELYQELTQYDLFRRLNLKLTENQISDVTADLLDPFKFSFAKNILVQLLDSAGKEKIATLFKQTGNKDIRVHREYAGQQSRIDIRIFTQNTVTDNNAVIDIELKVSGGSETKIKGKPQTIREWKDLEKFSEKKKIPKENIVAFFVTPHGNQAIEPNFISLSRDELNQHIYYEIADLKTVNGISPDGLAAIKYFLKSKWIF